MSNNPAFGSNTAGPHNSDMLNRLDDSDRDNSHTLGGNPKTGHNVDEGTFGPHGSKLANMADPSVDSDRDRTAGLNPTGPTGLHESAGAHALGAAGSSRQHGSDPPGLHQSHLANQADPRVDSSTTGHHSGSGIGSGFGSGLGSGVGSSHPRGSDPSGPHDSYLANKVDPRVDSTTTGDHPTSGIGSSHPHATDHSSGPVHQSNLLNKADPRVHDNTTGAESSVFGSDSLHRNAPNTAGPHKSDLLNKLDPRVDSDLDGSKTLGGDKTFE